MAGGAFRFLKFLAVLTVFGAVLFVSRSLWLPALAKPLIHDDGPAKADIAVVLAGDYWGHRIVKGAELVAAGYVPAVLVSGPDGHYGHYESELAIDYAVAKGYPRNWFIAVPNSSRSTMDEAHDVMAELRRRDVHSFLLVTSDYHTARSARIYHRVEREMGFAPEMRTVTAPDQFFRVDSWWRNREGQKTVFYEWCKTAATIAGN